MNLEIVPIQSQIELFNFEKGVTYIYKREHPLQRIK